MSAENILKMLQNGDITSPTEDITIDFAGKTWFVKSFVGGKNEAALLLEVNKTEGGMALAVTNFISAAIGLMTAVGLDNPVVREAIHMAVDEEFDRGSAFFVEHRANRGKPS